MLAPGMVFFKVFEYTSLYAIFITKANFSGFLFASLGNETLPERSFYLQGRIFSYKSKFFMS